MFLFECRFQPHFSAIIHPNTHMFFFLARYQHMINDDLSKKNHHIFEKSILVLSYLRKILSLCL